MKVSLLHQELRDALQLIRPAVATRTTLPILSHVLLQAGKGRVSLYATDLDLGIERTFSAQVEVEGRVCVPAKRFAEWVARVEGKVVVESDEEGRVVLSQAGQGRRRVRLVGMDPKEFPAVPRAKGGEEMTLDGAVLRGMVERVAFAAAPPSEARVVLTGVLLKREGGKLRLVATNAHRLAMCEVEVDGGGAWEVVVPARSLQEAARAVREGEVKMWVGEDLVVISAEGSRVFARPVEGKFPPYEQVIPKEWKFEWEVEVAPLRLALERAAVVARDDAGAVSLVEKEETLEIRAASQDVGEAEEVVALVRGGGGKDVEVAYNVGYLLECLGRLGHEAARVRINGKGKPTRIEPAEGSGFVYVIMPMELS